MKIKGINDSDTLEELDKAVDTMEDPYAWENYCSACDNFQTENCSFKHKITENTNWRKLGCTNFWD